jgi:hypothetical protein
METGGYSGVAELFHRTKSWSDELYKKFLNFGDFGHFLLFELYYIITFRILSLLPSSDGNGGKGS